VDDGQTQIALGAVVGGLDVVAVEEHVEAVAVGSVTLLEPCGLGLRRDVAVEDQTIRGVLDEQTASPTGGKLAVTLDAGTANQRSLGELDQCAPAAAQQQLRTFTGLGSGAHSLQLTYVGGSCGGAAAQGANVDAAVTYADQTTYDHDDDNRLLASHAGGQDTTYVYDANGSLLRRRNVQGLMDTTYGWDAAGRMAQSRVGTGPITAYAYDGDGARLSKATNGVTTTYVNTTLGLSSVLQEVTSGTGGKTVSRVPGIGELDSSKAAPNDWAYVHSDAQNGRALTNSYAQVGKWWDYDPWGVVRHESGGQDSLFDFAGEQRDDETGLVYLRARLYDPALGRFLSRDSWGGQDSSPQSWNRFSYAENDPIDFTDPSGHKKKIKWPNGQDPDDNPKAKAAAKCKNPGQYTGSCKGGPPNKAYAADGEAQHHAKVAGQAASAGDIARAIAEAIVATHLAAVAGTPAAFTAAAQAGLTVVQAAQAGHSVDNASPSHDDSSYDNLPILMHAPGLPQVTNCYGDAPCGLPLGGASESRPGNRIVRAEDIDDSDDGSDCTFTGPGGSIILNQMCMGKAVILEGRTYWPTLGGLIEVSVGVPMAAPPGDDGSGPDRSGTGSGSKGVWDTEYTQALTRQRPIAGRRRWKDAAGQILEYDPQHGGELEVYNKRGVHLGVQDLDGKWIKPAEPGRWVPT